MMGSTLPQLAEFLWILLTQALALELSATEEESKEKLSVAEIRTPDISSTRTTASPVQPFIDAQW